MIKTYSPVRSKQICFTSPDLLVPEDHYLRKINELMDWSFINDELKDQYNFHFGRPGYDPVSIVKILILSKLENLGSVRKTIENCRYNVAYMYFLNLNFGDPIPDHSTVSKIFCKKLLPINLFEKAFEKVLSLAIDNDLVDTDTIFVDSTHLKANNNPHNYVSAYVQNETKPITEELKKAVNEDRRAHNKKELKEKEEESFTSEDLKREIENIKAEYKEFGDNKKSPDEEPEIPRKENRARKEARNFVIYTNNPKNKLHYYQKEVFIPIEGKLKKLDELEEEIDLSECSLKKVGKNDCQSGWFRKGEHKNVFAYTTQAACTKSNLIISFSLSAGNTHDSVSFYPLNEKLKDFPVKMEVVDAGYKCPDIARELLLQDITPLMPYKRPMTKKGFFKKYEYVYDEYYDFYICPNNQTLKYTTTNRLGYKEYKSDPTVCKTCPVRDKCTESKDYTKLLCRHVWAEYLEVAEDVRHDLDNRETYKMRSKTIERVFGDVKEKHHYRFTYYTGRVKVEADTAVTFTAHNLKKIVRLLEYIE